MPFEQGNNLGAGTRFKPGQSGNPGGRPKGFSTLVRKVLAESTEAGGNMTNLEAIARKLIEMAIAGDIPAMRLVLDREWPKPSRLEIAGRDGGPVEAWVSYPPREAK